MGTKTMGGWETGTGYRREERKGKGEERGVPPASFSSHIYQCLQTVSHCESRRSQGKRVPQFCLRINFRVDDTSDLKWG